MPSPESNHGDVTVIFRKGDHLLIPPDGLPHEQRRNGETFEKTFQRLCNAQGVIGYADYAIPTHNLDESPQMAYLTHPRKNELDESEPYVHKDEVAEHLESHAGLSAVEKELFTRAVYLMNNPVSRRRAPR